MVTSPASPPADPDTARRTQAALAFYGPLAAATDPARRVGWESAAIQRVRLEALARAVGPLPRRASVLDAGCGEGALLPILRRRGFEGTYRGEDLLAGPIAHVTSPDPKATFVVADSFAGGPASMGAAQVGGPSSMGAAQVGGPSSMAAVQVGGPGAEAVVCSGALNTESGAASHDAEVAAAMTALWERTGEILAIDLAVLDRHAPGVGLARADLGKAFAHARSLAPCVVVREDLVPGEALITLSRSRGAGLLWTGADPLDRVEVLLMAGEATHALDRLESLGAAIGAGRQAAVADLPGGEASLAREASTRPEPDLLAARVALLRGLALAALGRTAEALSSLERAAAHPELATRARLAQAPIHWRLGDKARAERILTELASHDDEARAHLASLLSARGDRDKAALIASAITDAWIRREVLASLAR